MQSYKLYTAECKRTRKSFWTPEDVGRTFALHATVAVRGRDPAATPLPPDDD
jgi:hypothetical protein